GGAGFAEQVAATEARLAELEPGTRVVTFHGFGGEMPPGLALAELEEIEGGELALWVKRGGPGPYGGTPLRGPPRPGRRRAGRTAAGRWRGGGDGGVARRGDVRGGLDPALASVHEPDPLELAVADVAEHMRDHRVEPHRLAFVEGERLGADGDLERPLEHVAI